MGCNEYAGTNLTTAFHFLLYFMAGSISAQQTIFSVVGARPNFMKVAPLHRAFLPYQDQILHKIVHTGQHYDAQMSDAFFNDLEMPLPAYFLGVGSGSHAEQTARVMVEFEKICMAERPDLVIVVGDVNSTVAAALTAAKLGIRVAHVEAGLRSFDRSMPEELNRVVTDALCDYAFVTEQSGVDNLLREGWDKAGKREHLYFTGNTMIDSLHFVLPNVEQSAIVSDFHLEPRKYILLTLHRPSNVDFPEQLRQLVLPLLEDCTRRGLTLVFPIHPRTRHNIERFELFSGVESSHLLLIEPQGYINFLALMRQAWYVITDSGGIQEETTALGMPCFTLRTTTERPITIKLGTNVLVQPDGASLRAALEAFHTTPLKPAVVPPLWDGHAAERCAQIITALL